jgi:hypothetical protein
MINAYLVDLGKRLQVRRGLPKSGLIRPREERPKFRITSRRKFELLRASTAVTLDMMVSFRCLLRGELVSKCVERPERNSIIAARLEVLRDCICSCLQQSTTVYGKKACCKRRHRIALWPNSRTLAACCEMPLKMCNDCFELMEFTHVYVMILL